MFPIFWLVFLVSGLQGVPVRGSIQGMVVRAGAAAAGAPPQLADARVELTPGNIDVFTDANGKFIFRNLLPGRYLLSVTHDGFVPQEDVRRGLTLSGLSVTLAAGETLKDIELPMISVPVIAGRIFDPQGAPLAAVLVQAYRRQYTPYGTQLRIVRKGMTNDLGEFRLFGLNFGAYFVSAGYGDRDRATAIGRVQLSANVSKADDGYATIFFDGTEDISQAQVMRLSPGSDPATLNIYLADPARFKIRGQVLPLAGGTRVLIAPRGGDLTSADYFIPPDARGAFEIRGVSPGSYLVLATTSDGVWSSDVIPVNITDHDIEGLRLALETTMPISGALSLDGSSRADLSEFRVKLVRSSTEFDQKIDTFVNPNGRFSLAHVVPTAEYDIVVEPLPPGTYVKSISSGGRNFLSGKSRLFPNYPGREWLRYGWPSFLPHFSSLHFGARSAES